MANSDEIVVADLYELIPQAPADLLAWADLDQLLTRRARTHRALAVTACVAVVAAIVVGAVSLKGGASRTTTAEPVTVNGPLLISQHIPTAKNRYNTDLALVDPTTGEVHPLMRDSVNDSGAAVSPDGREIAYVATTTSRAGFHVYQDHDIIHVTDSTGAADHAVFTCGGVCSGLTWSPNGAELAVADNGITVVTIGGSSRQVCGSICSTNLAQPAWSPNGDEIAFVQNKQLASSQTVGATAYPSSAIWTVNEDGASLTQLTDRQCSLVAASSCSIDTAPTWSPDGQQIAFSTSATEPEVIGRHGPDQATRTNLDVMNTDGARVRRLFTCPTGSCQAIVSHWSPDGTQLAFVTRNDTGSGSVEVVPAAGGQPTVMPIPPHHHNQYFVAVSWSPDGTRLAMLLSHGYQSRLLTALPDGTGLRELRVPHVRGYDDGTLIWTPQPANPSH